MQDGLFATQTIALSRSNDAGNEQIGVLLAISPKMTLKVHLF